MSEFVDYFTAFSNGQSANAGQAIQYLTALLEENPSVYLGNLIGIITESSLPLSLRINAIKSSTVFAQIKIESDGFAESVSMKDVDTSLIDNLVEILQRIVLSPEEFLPSETDPNQITDFMICAAKSLANYKIALFLLNGSDPQSPFPALEYLQFISPEHNQFVCDAASTVIEIIIEALPLSKTSVVEQIISVMLNYLSNAETSLVFKHIFINIVGIKLKEFGVIALEKNLELGVAFLQKLDELMEILPEECFWFWLQVATNCYPLLRLCADLPQIMFSAIESIIQTFANDENKKLTMNKILTNIMQFWYVTCQVENGTSELAKQNNLDLVSSNIEQLLTLTLTIIQSDDSTEAYTQGDYNSFIAAIDTLRVLINNNFETCFPHLFEFITENLSSDDKSARFAAAFCFRTLLDSAKHGSPQLQQMASCIVDAVTDLLTDESPRICMTTLHIISLGVIKGILDISQDIYDVIIQQAQSDNQIIQLEAIRCLGRLGRSLKGASLIDTIVGNLFEIATQVEDGALSSSTFEIIRDCVINLDPETLSQLFDSVTDFTATLLEQPDAPNLASAASLINRIFVILCKKVELSEVGSNILPKFLELSIALLPTSAASVAILSLGIATMYFGSNDPEIIQKTMEVIVHVLTDKDNTENIFSALEACLSVIHVCDDESILHVIAEKNIEILADSSLDPNAQCLTLDIFGSIAEKSDSIIGQLIEGTPLIQAMTRLLNQGDRLADIKYVYNFIVALTHFIQPGTEIDAALVNMIKKSIKQIGGMTSIPKSLADVAIDLLFNLSQRNEEGWEKIKHTTAARNIMISSSKATDSTTIERRNHMLQFIEI